MVGGAVLGRLQPPAGAERARLACREDCIPHTLVFPGGFWPDVNMEKHFRTVIFTIISAFYEFFPPAIKPSGGVPRVISLSLHGFFLGPGGRSREVSTGTVRSVLWVLFSTCWCESLGLFCPPGMGLSAEAEEKLWEQVGLTRPLPASQRV